MRDLNNSAFGHLVAIHHLAPLAPTTDRLIVPTDQFCSGQILPQMRLETGL